MRVLSGCVIGLAAGMAMAAQAKAVDLEVGGSFRVTGFAVDDTNQDSGPLRQAYQQRTRLNFDLGLDDGISLIAGADLRSGYWYGDPVTDGDSQRGRRC